MRDQRSKSPGFRRHLSLWAIAAALLLALACDMKKSPGATSVTDPDTTGPGLNDDGSCSGVVDDVTVENLIVDDDDTCILDGTNITGHLFVHNGATLVARDLRVAGNIEADGARSVDVGGATEVGGSVRIMRGDAAEIDSLTIDGELRMEENSGLIVANGNDVGDDMKINKNVGGVILTGNRVERDLECRQNSPAPTGGGNQADDKEGQCEDL